MVTRRELAAWLQGPGAVGNPPADTERPGKRLALPAEGPGSLAGVGARILAFLADSVMCAAIAWGLFREPAWTTPIFALEVFLLTALGGGSAGQRLTGLRVVGLDGGPVGFGRAAIRTLLMLLLIPVLIWDRDGRGLHDKAAGTVLVRAR